jgi:hypothetical protein
LDFSRISSITDDAKDDLEVALHGTWNWLKRWWVGIGFAIGILNVKLNN